jgi:hypothetical protein
MPHAFGRLTSRIILSGLSECHTNAVRRLPWRVWPLPAYDARCLLKGLEVLSDTNALFAREILVGKVDCADLALVLRFEEVPYSRRRNAGLLTFFHRITMAGSNR